MRAHVPPSRTLEHCVHGQDRCQTSARVESSQGIFLTKWLVEQGSQIRPKEGPKALLDMPGPTPEPFTSIQEPLLDRARPMKVWISEKRVKQVQQAPTDGRQRLRDSPGILLGPFWL